MEMVAGVVTPTLEGIGLNKVRAGQVRCSSPLCPILMCRVSSFPRAELGDQFSRQLARPGVLTPRLPSFARCTLWAFSAVSLPCSSVCRLDRMCVLCIVSVILLWPSQSSMSPDSLIRLRRLKVSPKPELRAFLLFSKVFFR